MNRVSKALGGVTVLISLLTMAGPALAKDAEAQRLFEEGNQRYEKGEFDEALSRYSALAGRGFGSAELFYNLGNVHFRRGERGRAILWYERAARVAPRDTDVRFNLALARSHIKAEGDNLFRRAALHFNENELSAATAIFSALFFSLVGFWTLGKLKGDTWPGMAILVTGVLFLGSGSWLGLRVYLDRQPHAIVVAPPGEVRNGPGNDYAVGFTVPEGSRVLILNTRPEWTQVGVPEQGLKGWMPTTELEPVTSRAVS
jgi:hypothetical protein